MRLYRRGSGSRSPVPITGTGHSKLVINDILESSRGYVEIAGSAYLVCQIQYMLCSMLFCHAGNIKRES